MTTRNRSTQLTKLVKRVVEEMQLERFEEYWALYKATCPIDSVEAFYFRTERRDSNYSLSGGNYCNVAIIGADMLVDIEADDSDKSGYLIAQPLRSIGDVSLHVGSLKNLPPSQDASVVVLANRVGEEDVGVYWVAKTDEERDNLMAFAKHLIQAIAKP